ncbi:hypothetical protein HPP92_012667 [Vanilla planifolia]|uniref:Uncharacterized protein n=1 Tax=Vanilla planifolia TaxID=51239 RepID=A0A835R0W6_VANPL|nr:hypothetical protein HPP92_012667 [Vanilla planifolia]
MDPVRFTRRSRYAWNPLKRLLMPKFEKSSWEQDPSGTRKTDAEQSTEESKKVNK